MLLGLADLAVIDQDARQASLDDLERPTIRDRVDCSKALRSARSALAQSSTSSYTNERKKEQSASWCQSSASRHAASADSNEREPLRRLASLRVEQSERPPPMDRGAAKSLHELAFRVAALDRLLDGHRAESHCQGREVATCALLCDVADLLRELGASSEGRRRIRRSAEVAQHESLVSKRVREARTIVDLFEDATGPAGACEVCGGTPAPRKQPLPGELHSRELLETAIADCRRHLRCLLERRFRALTFPQQPKRTGVLVDRSGSASFVRHGEEWRDPFKQLVVGLAIRLHEMAIVDENRPLQFLERRRLARSRAPLPALRDLAGTSPRRPPACPERYRAIIR